MFSSVCSEVSTTGQKAAPRPALEAAPAPLFLGCEVKVDVPLFLSYLSFLASSEIPSLLLPSLSRIAHVYPILLQCFWNFHACVNSSCRSIKFDFTH